MTLTLDVEPPASLGGARPIQLPATTYCQGKRVMYHLVVPLADLTHIVQRPDSTRPIEGNRRVDATRARKFGEYLLGTESWVSPAIIVRAPSGEISFEATKRFEDGTAWGVLNIPLHVLTEILLLDGQHRTLGTFLALDTVNSKINNAREVVQKAKKDQSKRVVAEAEKRLADLLEQRDRLAKEHISVDLAVVTDSEAKLMFADINNNAKGVNPDYKTYLDQRDVVNRIAVDLITSHPLLVDRVEIGQGSRMSSTNPNLIGAKSVADIVRSVHVGAGGRIGKRVEDELSTNQRAATARVKSFLDLLCTSFDDLAAVLQGRKDPVSLRPHTMILSGTMLRVLGAVFHDLTSGDPDHGIPPMSHSDVEVFFRSLEPHMKAIPLTADNEFWMSTGAFMPGGSAPQGMQGSIRKLVDALVARGRAAAAV